MAKKYSTGAVIADAGNIKKHKTGNWRTMKPVKIPEKCINCGRCWMYCPDNAINENFEINYDYCKGCGICAKECPVKAIRMEREEK